VVILEIYYFLTSLAATAGARNADV
jgi:hypothetical protein